MYPADIAGISATVPGSQAASGVFEGGTLGTYDYIECELATTADGGDFPLGVVLGTSIGQVTDWSDVSPWPLADGNVLVIQRRGIVASARTDGSTALGDYLINGDTGEITSAATAATNCYGVALTTDAAYTRVTAADQTSSIVYISC